MRTLAPPRQSGVLNKSLGFERPLSKARGSLKPWRGQEPVASRSPSRSPKVRRRGELFLTNVPEGRTRHTRLLKPRAPHTYGWKPAMASQSLKIHTNHRLAVCR